MAEDKDNKEIDIDKDNIQEELSDEMIGELVTELNIIYPNTPRGVIYEAVVGCKNESFLTIHLKDQEAKYTPVIRELTIGDLFSTGDNKEITTVVKFGKKAKISKALTIGAAISLSLAKTLYSIVTDSDIKKDLDEIDIVHSEELLAKAKSLTDKDSSENNNKTESKTKKEGK